jgi:hypothetical protein
MSNLPPGVSVWMIPGNRPEDEAWETFAEQFLPNLYNYEEETFDLREVESLWWILAEATFEFHDTMEYFSDELTGWAAPLFFQDVTRKEHSHA